ncbi:hypothetical protein TNCV_1393291 [Trichonephila clavipes]|nr:hypothetical protein TNCV_1393291 [Trichonephila clavipes]
MFVKNATRLSLKEELEKSTETERWAGQNLLEKNSSGRSPLTDERIPQLSCNMIGRDRSTQKVGVENRLGRSGNKRPGTRRS